MDSHPFAERMPMKKEPVIFTKNVPSGNNLNLEK
jgi:hypothetical protein